MKFAARFWTAFTVSLLLIVAGITWGIITPFNFWFTFLKIFSGFIAAVIILLVTIMCSDPHSAYDAAN